jgi:hypothetical protein
LFEKVGVTRTIIDHPTRAMLLPANVDGNIFQHVTGNELKKENIKETFEYY